MSLLIPSQVKLKPGTHFTTEPQLHIPTIIDSKQEWDICVCCYSHFHTSPFFPPYLTFFPPRLALQRAAVIPQMQARAAEASPSSTTTLPHDPASSSSTAGVTAMLTCSRRPRSATRSVIPLASPVSLGEASFSLSFVSYCLLYQ